MRILKPVFASACVIAMMTSAQAGSSFIDFGAKVAKRTPSIIKRGKAPEPKPAMEAAMEKAEADEKAEKTTADTDEAKPKMASKSGGPVMVIKEGEVSSASVREPIMKKKDQEPSSTEMSAAEGDKQTDEAGASSDDMAKGQPDSGTDDIVTSASDRDEQDTDAKVTESPFQSDELRLSPQ